jgi:acid stress chaperone HdeB
LIASTRPTKSSAFATGRFSAVTVPTGTGAEGSECAGKAYAAHINNAAQILTRIFGLLGAGLQPDASGEHLTEPPST